MSDIRIYNFEFELMGILPEEQCSSINYKKEFNGIGSFEIDFCSDRIADLIEENIDVLFLEYEDFQGYFTGYLYKENSNYKVFGKSLNGLLHKRVIPKHGSVNTTHVYHVVRTYYDFLVVPDGDAETIDSKNFETTKYLSGDKFVSELLSIVDAGYRIYADKIQKKFVFRVLGKNDSDLVLCDQNLNAYAFEFSYDNKELASCGCYEEKTTQIINNEEVISYEPRYIFSDESKQGIYRDEILLESTSSAAREVELYNKKAIHKMNCATKRVRYGVDYQLGDIVRIQYKNSTVRKMITAISVSREVVREEFPTFTEV